MNDDTIKAAEEYAVGITTKRVPCKYNGFIVGSEYMRIQKDEQIKELVGALMYARQFVTPECTPEHEKYISTIQKYKQ